MRGVTAACSSGRVARSLRDDIDSDRRPDRVPVDRNSEHERSCARAAHTDAHTDISCHVGAAPAARLRDPA